ncbi:hypothetical protein Sjap_007497 [Stephania japonica]|uniref:Uncharacterized protein n=1 Tax=Stephania japonica TaxID=461633 RepID=A0AAP0JMT2_9MAGN
MASTSTTAAIFAFILMSSLAIATSKDLGFYYFVLMWPGAYCKQTNAGCCTPKSGKPALDFFVKGLYPYSTDGTPLTKCNRTPFINNQISDLEGELLKYWSNIKCPSSEPKNLWRSAWKTYGVCSGLSEHEYFKKTLELKNKIDLLSILCKNGIVPTDMADYSFLDVKKAVSKGVRATNAIRCSKNQWDETIVYEFYVCVDKDAKNIINCPVLPNFTCTPRVVFGSFTYSMLKNKTKIEENPIRMPVDDE